MMPSRIPASVAVCVVCGCAFAGVLLSNGVAGDKAAVAGLFVAVPSAAIAGVAVFARAAKRFGQPGPASTGAGQ